MNQKATLFEAKRLMANSKDETVSVSRHFLGSVIKALSIEPEEEEETQQQGMNVEEQKNFSRLKNKQL